MFDHDVSYFLALAKTGSLARAADVLGLTQPALSKSLQRLEKRVGATLVARTSRGSSLTAAGATFAQRMRVICRYAEDASQEAKDLSGGQAGQLRIGATPAASVFALNALFPTLQLERPAATVSFVNAFDHALMDALVRQDVELVICPLPNSLDPSLNTELLFEDSYCLVVNSTHPLAVRGDISLNDLASCSWVSSPKNEYARQQTETAFERAGLSKPKVIVEVNSLPALLVVIANTKLVSMINSRGILPGHLPKNVVMKPLPKVVVQCPIGIVWRKRYMSSLGQRAMQLLKTSSTNLEINS